MTVILDLNKNSGMLDLTKAAPALKKLRGVLDWDKNTNAGQNNQQKYDLDIFAFVLNAQGKISGSSDVVFFNNKSASGVSIPRDNQDGSGDIDEEIFITLPDVPASKEAIGLFVFIHDAVARMQTFGLMKNSTFALYNDETKELIQKYALTSMSDQTAVHIGNLVRQGAGWGFEPYGDAFSGKSPNDFAAAYAP